MLGFVLELCLKADYPSVLYALLHRRSPSAALPALAAVLLTLYVARSVLILPLLCVLLYASPHASLSCSPRPHIMRLVRRSALVYQRCKLTPGALRCCPVCRCAGPRCAAPCPGLHQVWQLRGAGAQRSRGLLWGRCCSSWGAAGLHAQSLRRR